MTDQIDEIIKQIELFEGGATATNDPVDKGGRTQWGISEHSWPAVWADGKVSEQEAHEIYLQQFIIAPGFHRIPPSHGRVQAQLADFGVTSGPSIAVKYLQIALGMPAQDGVFGEKTLAALTDADPHVINNRLVVERVKMICRLVAKNPSQIKFLGGWCARALFFLT